MRIKIFSFLISLLIFSSCSEKISQSPSQQSPQVIIKDSLNIQKDFLIESEYKEDTVHLGIDRLEAANFQLLANKRVALITNQTGVNRHLKSTIDVLNEAENVNLVALFGPEHGVRGEIEGGQKVEFYQDSKTDLPVYSLYGKTRKPTKEMLKNIDILVYDIQDIGARSYTYISTLGLAITAASENNIEFIVLDRPNPLGGEKVEGNLVEEKYISFISQFPIPYIYGLTCGELAQLLVNENMINTAPNLSLLVVPMKNWKRSMIWEDTKLKWVPTSPHIPHSYSPFFYPMTGVLGELRSSISIGVGYTLPFQIVGTEWINPHELAEELNNKEISGIHFMPISFKPYYAFGKNKTLHGVQLHILEYNNLELIKVQFHIILAIKKLYPSKNLFSFSSENELSMFNKAIGSNNIYEMLSSEFSHENLFQFLDKDIEKFRNLSLPYYLYK